MMLLRHGPDAAEMLAALPVATLVVDGDNRIAFANAASEALLNLSERAMLGRAIGHVLPLPGADRARDGQAYAAFDVEVESASGVRIRVDVTAADMPEQPGWQIVTLHNASLRRAAQRVERTAAARSAIGAAAMLAHEIKNPLSSIRGAAQLIADGADQTDLTRLVIAEVDRIAALIDRMEDFTDTRPLELAALNIYPLLTHARDVARTGFARDIVIEERYDPSLPPALVNHDALLQVVINLLNNAAVALGPIGERRITLATAYRHGFTIARTGQERVALPIEICVMDTGPGAPEELADHLFEPFVSGRPEGKGLGLALVDKLVRDMGGVVQYSREGTPNVTVFRILLPRAPA